MNLFMFYIGGDCGNSNIELHDVRFSMGETAEACYEDLRNQWWGTPKSLHLDSWGIIEQADGFDLVLSDEPYTGPHKLFFLNMGGYNGDDFEELHKNVLLVEETQHKAIVKAMKTIREWQLPHRDAILEIEKIINISEYLEKAGKYLHLIPATETKPFEFISKYVRINIEQFQ